MLGKLGLKLLLGGLFAVIIIYHFIPNVWRMPWVPMTLWGLMGVGFILWFVFSIEWIINWVQKRSSQFVLSVVISAVALIGILAAANWGALQLQTIYPKVFKADLTRSNIHSLSEQTKKVLANLKEDVTLEIWTFNLREMSGSIDMPRFLGNYVSESGKKVSYVVRNPNDARLDAIKNRVSRRNVIVAKSAAGREVRIDNFNDAKAEEQITNAIVQVAKGRKKNVCFISGHGELNPNTGTPPESISEMKSSLEGSAYSVRDLALITEKVPPNSCELVVSAGPLSAPSESEIKLMQEYLAQGGKLLALWGFQTPQAWHKITQPYGLSLDNNILIDKRVQGAVGIVTKSYAHDSDLLRGFEKDVLMTLARSISVPPAPPPGVHIRRLVTVEQGTLTKAADIRTVKQGVLSAAGLTLAGDDAVVVEAKKSLTPETDPKRTTNSAEAAASDEGKETAILVVGSHTLASNQYFYERGNEDFMLNTVSYLLKDSDLISVRPKDIKSARLELTRERINYVQGYLLLSTMLFLVLAIGAAFGRKTTLA